MTDQSRVSHHRTLFWAAMEMSLRHPLRFWVTVGCMAAVATPFLVGLAILEGVRFEAAASVAAGPDLLVTGYEHGRNASIDATAAALAKRIYRVEKSRGRIVGRAYIEKGLVSVAGLEEAKDLPAPGPGEGWVGASLAHDRQLTVGSMLTLGDVGEITLKIGRVFPPDSGLASSRLVVMSLKDAQTLFGTPSRISDLQIWVKDDERERAQNLLRVTYEFRKVGIPYLIETKKLVSDYVDRGLTLKGGSFLALYVVALAVLVPALLVTSGFGLSTRRREIGLMKALGFSVLDVLEMATDEVMMLSLFGTLISFLLAWSWIRLGHGFLIASFFIAELEQGNIIEIPALFLPGPLLVTYGMCLLLLSIGVIYTSYRVAIVPPLESLR